MVTVVSPTLLPDIYEPNNSLAQAYELSLNFSGNQGSANTQGSNCHAGNDYDVYKVTLPQGYSYSVTARLHDEQNSGNGQTYSLDAIFSVSPDGNTWSDAYDNFMDGPIDIYNGVTV